jgi:hypothetical protein
MRLFGLGRRKKTVVVATERAGEVLPLLEGHQVQIEEAFTTGGVYGVVDKASLVILGVEDLVETTMSRAGLMEALDKASVRVLSPDELLRDPEGHLAQLEGPKGIRRLTPLRLGLVSLSGGVGCTTLACELARRAADHHEATVALAELTWGNGALRARLSLDGAADLYQVALDLSVPGQEDGITVVPIKQQTAKLLLGNLDKITQALDALAHEHVLLIVDAHGAHPLWTAAQEVLDRVLVVTDQRPDAVGNAQLLLKSVNGSGSLVVNKATVQDRVALGLTGQEACLIPKGAEDSGRRLIEFLYE